MKRLFFVLFILSLSIHSWGGIVNKTQIQNTVDAIVKTHGADQQQRAETGVQQTAVLWMEQDGTPEAFKEFCVNNFISDNEKLDQTFQRFQNNMEVLWGHNHEINRYWSKPITLEVGEVLPVDYLFAEYDPFAHLEDDLFKTKLAFVVLLNFEQKDLNTKLEQGDHWDRKEWAMARLAELTETRVPAEVNQSLASASVQVDDYIANYNIVMNSLVNDKNERLFPTGLKLISHWGLRDELKSHYGQKDGLPKQEMIYNVMLHIIRQDIPKQIINSDAMDWNPFTNTLYKKGNKQTAIPEPDTRYQHWLNVFHAQQKADPYYPNYPTQIDRRFNRYREIPEEKVEALLQSVLTAPIAKETAAFIKTRLGRDLQPFDIWYDGFKARSSIDQAELDRMVGEKYPSVAAFQEDLPNILQNLDFNKETAEYLASKITVDPSRGAGHASGAMRKDDNAHLRTRIPETGMKYKGYNIAIHELGHNVEQVLSLNKMDQYMLFGVPNTAFTEAFAFVFQSRDLELLGAAQNDPTTRYLKALDTYWSTCEISAVSLVDMRAWRWLYDHPQASPAEFKVAVIDIAKEVWNNYFAPLIGVKDSEILAIYSHLVAYGLYTPDYALGHMIMYQIEQYLVGKQLGVEMERMCRIGRVAPDTWMKQAVDNPLSAQPLIESAKEALQVLKQQI